VPEVPGAVLFAVELFYRRVGHAMLACPVSELGQAGVASGLQQHILGTRDL
jgi:hypothetical protein